MYMQIGEYNPDFAKQEFCCEGVGHVIFNLRSGVGIGIGIIYLPSGTRGVVAQSPEPGAHDKSD